MEVMKPFATTLSFAERVITPYGQRIERRLSHMRGMYQDIAETKAILEREDPLIYEVYTVDVPEKEGQLLHCLTVLHPGQIGDEYYMTKGHFHVVMSTAEIYLGLEGKGYILMQTKEGDFQALEMERGTIAYVPPHWAHRTVNTGKGPFVFFAVWPGHSGHDYRGLYPEGSYGPARSSWKQITLRLKELCEQYGIRDRIPRPIIPGDKRILSKRIVKGLANQLYCMDLNGEPSRHVWAYRRAAWALEDTPQNLGLIYRQMGVKGLESIENVGPKLAQVGEALIRQWA